VVNNYRKFGIPLEVVWNDIDYMFQYRDFTNDPNTFGIEAGKDFFDKLAANNQHYIP
jgi:alpha-glucosidase